MPIDPNRAHVVDFAVSWHGRAMTLAWGGLAPLAILFARYFKVLPQQDWPRELDSQVWWRIHWIGQSTVLLLTVFAVGLVLSQAGPLGIHGALGYLVLVCVAAQVATGVMRGTKGGPTAPSPSGDVRGDHYDMTPWRKAFEAAHKSLGYLVLVLASIVIVLGLWETNAPRWMWLALAAWSTCLFVLAIMLQRRGQAIDTYQAIWGPGLEHPGNRMAAPRWGMRRLSEKEAQDVRRH